MNKKIYSYFDVVIEEIRSVFSNIDNKQIEEFMSKLKSKKRIYIAGVGRSGLVVKAFGQRLMHLGYDVHLADEITAPAIARGDILICCSATGKTQLTLFMAKRARDIGSYVIGFTANDESPMSKICNYVVRIPSPLDNSSGQTVQPARSLFEQVLYMLFDSVVCKLIDDLKISQSKVNLRHANLE